MRTTTLIRDCMLALVLAIVLPALATAQTLDRIKASGAINIGYVSDAAPFSVTGADGKPAGYSIDLCQKVVEGVKAKLGLPALAVNYTATSVADGLNAVAAGSVDMLCGSTTDTLARRERVSFSIPIYNGGIGVLLRKNAPSDLVRVLNGEVAHTGPTWRATVNQGLAKHTYAVREGTLTEAQIRERVAQLGVIVTIVPVKSHQEGVDMVASGKADAYFADRAILTHYAGSTSGMTLLERYFTYEPIALAVARNDDDMRLVVDTALSRLYQSDGFKDFYAGHFGKPGDVTLMFFKSFARH
jgi:polar amino acid transport system substrate-binding protein